MLVALRPPTLPVNTWRVTGTSTLYGEWIEAGFQIHVPVQGSGKVQLCHSSFLSSSLFFWLPCVPLALDQEVCIHVYVHIL